MPKGNNKIKKESIVKKLNEIKKLVDQCITIIEEGAVLERSSNAKKDVNGLKRKKIDFNLNIRNFVNKYARNLNGTGKFVLLLAYLAHGDKKKEISLSKIDGSWNRMIGLLGMRFNTKYPVEAKDNGWVNSKKRGLYILTDTWEEIFGE